jgi:hypothetical protein
MTAKSIFDLPLGAGIYTEETERGSKGFWRSADKVRFRKGLPEKIGGWTQLQPMFLGKARRIIDWTSLDGKKWTALATELKLYLWQDDTLYNITPLRRTVTLGTDPFATVSASATVTVTDVAHGCQVGDFVTFSGATAVNGLDLNGEHQVATVPGADTYTLTAASNATGTGSGGGSAVKAEYEITVGSESAVTGRGWGTGVWSAGTWGTPRTGLLSTTVLPLRTWSLDNWGEDLIASPNGGSIYWWDRTNGPSQRASKLEGPGIPEVNQFVIISQRDRQVISLGAYDYFNQTVDPLLVRWCSTEDFTDWIPTVTNTAGDIRLYRGSKLVTGVRTRGELIVWTDTTMYSLPSVGPPEVFGANPVGENVTILGPMAAIAVDYRVFFMGEADFYIYDGILRVLPCTVRNHVYNNLDVAQKDKTYCGLNREFNEIWWLYPETVADPLVINYTFSTDDGSASGWQQQNNSATLGLPTWKLGIDPAEALLTGDFSASSQSATFERQPTSGTYKYTIAWNAGGGVGCDSFTTGVYDAAWWVIDPSPYLRISTNTIQAKDFSATFKVVTVTSAADCGLILGAHNLTGTADTDADTFSGVLIELDPSANTIRFRFKNATTGARQVLVSNPADVILSTLGTPITITAGNSYTILAQIVGPSIMKVWLRDEASGVTQNIGGTISLDFSEYNPAFQTANPKTGVYMIAAGQPTSTGVNAILCTEMIVDGYYRLAPSVKPTGLYMQQQLIPTGMGGASADSLWIDPTHPVVDATSFEIEAWMTFADNLDDPRAGADDWYLFPGGGPVFNVVDLSGTANQFSDNWTGIAAYLDANDNKLYIYGRSATGGFRSLANGPASGYLLTSLATPVTVDPSETYRVRVRRDGAALSFWVYWESIDLDQLVGTFNLTSTDEALYTGTVTGLMGSPYQATSDGAGTAAVAFTDFKAGPVGQTFGATVVPSAEISAYVAYNYEEDTWVFGSISRTAWQDRSPVLEKPYAAGTDGYLYQHETGVDDNGAAMSAYLESYMMEIPQSGEELMHVDQLIPDFLTLEGTVNVSLTGRKYPQDPNLITKGPYPVTTGTRKLSVRMRARQVAIRLESSLIGDKWRSGKWRGRAGAHGKRG